jgi:predicted nucleic acid-binding protein
MVSRYVVLDSNVLCSSFIKSDKKHSEAVKILKNIESDARILLTPLSIFEIATVLIKNGFSQNETEKIIKALSSQEDVIIINLSDVQFLYSAEFMDFSKNIRTHDFYILQTAIKFDADIYTFDKSFIKNISQIYNRVYDNVK